MTKNSFFNLLFEKLLSHKTRRKSERVILIIAIISFMVHLILIYLTQFGYINIDPDSPLFKNPIAAIYTPFSFILIYEIYLLIYYLPKSITNYIGKQYEIISLIIIRRLFKDLSSLELSSNWFQIKNDLQFTYDLIASLLLFYLLYLFFVQSKKRYRDNKSSPINLNRFIELKKIIAVCLVPLLLVIATYSFVNWFKGAFYVSGENLINFKSINSIFFDEFFTILIIVDVILLLFSFFYTDQFHKVIRNSGFIISTILIRLSFGVEGLINTLLIVIAVIFGLLILSIHNLYEKNVLPDKKYN